MFARCPASSFGPPAKDSRRTQYKVPDAGRCPSFIQRLRRMAHVQATLWQFHAPRSLRTVEDERDFHKAGVSPPRGD